MFLVILGYYEVLNTKEGYGQITISLSSLLHPYMTMDGHNTNK